MKVDVIYADNHVLVAVKPCNMPVQQDDSGDLDLLTYLKQYVKETYHKPGAAYLGLVHRLDRPTGGLLVFARTSKAAARLSAQVRTHTLGKEYLCLCTGQPPCGVLEDYLLKDAVHNTVRVVTKATPGAKLARLQVEPLLQLQQLTLCRVQLHTGRSHQIRVQLSSRGAPLWGDQRYNPQAAVGQQLALWAYRLSIEHPTLHDTRLFTALPQGSIWQPFLQAIDTLVQQSSAQGCACQNQ